MLRKSELIRKLEEIDGDPVVFIDVDGTFSDDVSPVCYQASDKIIASIDKDATHRPAVGEPIILI